MARSAGVVSKPGVVACETVECNAKTEVCCADTKHHTGRCVPAPPASDTNPCADAEAPWRCDENADCGGGQTCCESYACSDGCPTERVCETGLCSATNTEVCVQGAACRAGFSCFVDKGAKAGDCRLAPHTTPCGAKACAAGEACCWNKTAKQATCAEECDDVEGVVGLNCVSPGQCGGYACADFFVPGRPGGTSVGCMAASFAGDRASVILCRSVADCPRHLGDLPTACRESYPDLPHGVKQCVYP